VIGLSPLKHVRECAKVSCRHALRCRNERTNRGL
jgi:hypothetical protein